MASSGAIPLTGGTGKISSRILPLLSSNGNNVLVASRTGKFPPLPNTVGVKFDWLDSTTYLNPFSHSPISAIFLIAPPIMDCFPPNESVHQSSDQEGSEEIRVAER